VAWADFGRSDELFGLTELDLTTVLIERGCVGAQGASRYSGGIFRIYDPDDAIQDLAIYALTRMTDTRVGTAFASTLVRGGVYYATEEPVPQSALDYAAQRDLGGYPIRILSRRAASAEIGSLHDGQGGPVIVEPAGGYGDVRASARAVIRDLHRTGAVLENARWRAMEHAGGTVTIRFEGGAVRARRLVVATGSWAGELCPSLPIRTRSIPMVRMRTAKPAPVPVIDIRTSSYFVPVGRDMIQVGSRVRDEASRPENLAFDEPAIIADAGQRLAAMTGNDLFGEPIDVVRGFDGYTKDGRPVIGALPNSEVLVALGFAGIGYKLAVGAAWALARQIRSILRDVQLPETERRLLAPFSPGRFERPADDLLERMQT